MQEALLVVCNQNTASTGDANCPSGYSSATLQAYVSVPTDAFDYTTAGTAFGFGLTTVLTFWALGKVLGLFVGLVNKF